LEKLSNTELLILLLKYSTDNKIEGRTRFQKIVYLLKELSGINFSYDFKPYFYGPYSSELQNDINLLTELGVCREEIKTVAVDIIPGWKYTYILSDAGKKLAEYIEKKLDEQYLEKFKEHVRKIEKLSTGALILMSKYVLSKKMAQIQ